MSHDELQSSEAMNDAARLMLAAAREHSSRVMTDLHLPEDARLNEWQRLTASALLLYLVRSIEGMFRARLVDQFRDKPALCDALGAAHVEIAMPVLERGNIMRDPDLASVLVRRVEEHRYWKEYSPATGDLLPVKLANDNDKEIAREASALLIARSHRIGRFQEPVMGQADLPAELQHRLVWAIAAALRQYIIQNHAVPSGLADATISVVASNLIARHDEGQGIEAICMRLASALMAVNRLQGSSLVHILQQGHFTLFIASLAVLCSLDYASAWEIFSAPGRRGPALLLRCGKVDRQSAATIFLMINARGQYFTDQQGEISSAQIDFYDKISESAAYETLQAWRMDPGYRAAILRLSDQANPESGSL